MAPDSTTAPQASVPAYARAAADYAPSTHPDASGALVTAVRPDSPAYDAGLEPGMRVLAVNGEALTDMVVWLWESADEYAELEVLDPRDGTVAAAELERMPGEDWGVEFDGAVFDGMRTCVNACAFCFMTMLPKGMRRSLYLRDDDYRLSFLQGNFVTLTNMDDEDVADAVRRHLSPMNVSLHAVTPEVRRRLMGANAARGMEVLGRLMEAGIEIHAQIVLCPGVNDGEELDRTLAFAEANPAITSMGIVPLGFTAHQRRFERSYSDDPAAARAVIEQVRPYRERARERCGRAVFQLSDEFYLDARLPVPPAEEYDGYPQYYDGIGMIRSYLDDTAALRAEGGRLAAVSAALARAGLRLAVVSGEGAADTVRRLVGPGGLDGEVIAVANRFFGGNVNVTGLICGVDLLGQLAADLTGVMLIVPNVIFNADGRTLDGYHQDDITRELDGRGARTLVASTMPYELARTLERELALG